jgi:hypothetical protein
MLYSFLTFTLPATCFAHLALVYFNTLILFGANAHQGWRAHVNLEHFEKRKIETLLPYFCGSVLLHTLEHSKMD